MIRKIELTSKLMVALIAAVAFSAIAVPSYAIRILSSDIVDGEVKTVDIANNAVTTAKIGSGQVNNADIATSAVTADKIKTGVIESGHIADGTIKAVDIAEGVIPTESGTGTPNVQQISETINITPDEHGLVYAQCPSGTVVTGGGYSTEMRELNTAHVFTSRADVDNNRWEIRAYNPSSVFDVQITAYADCLSIAP